MTREEAIEYFKYYRKIFCEDHLKICPKDSIAYQATLKEKEFYDMAIKALEQEPKIGHWIMTSDYLTTAYGSVDYVKCSCCGEDSLEEGDYCPNCGARMIESQESEG